MFGMGPSELVIVGIIAVLLFGKRLPEVAKSLGSSYREFRSGLSSLQSEVNLDDTNNYGSKSSSYEGSSYDEFDDHEEVTAPKFEPPPSAPQPETESSTATTPTASAGEQNEDNTQ